MGQNSVGATTAGKHINRNANATLRYGGISIRGESATASESGATTVEIIEKLKHSPSLPATFKVRSSLAPGTAHRVQFVLQWINIQFIDLVSSPLSSSNRITSGSWYFFSLNTRLACLAVFPI